MPTSWAAERGQAQGRPRGRRTAGRAARPGEEAPSARGHAREARRPPNQGRAVMSTAARSAEAPGTQAARTRSMSSASHAACARPAACPARCRAAESPALKPRLGAGLQRARRSRPARLISRARAWGRLSEARPGGPRARLGEREGALRLQLQRVVRAQLDLVGLRQVAPAQPDRLACTPRSLTQRAAGSLPALLQAATPHACSLHILQVWALRHMHAGGMCIAR